MGISHKTPNGFPTRFFAIGDLESANSHIQDLSGRFDVYHSVGRYKEKSVPGSRGLESGIGALPALWYDLDCESGVHKKGGPKPTVNQAMDFLLSLPLKPSLCVFSGGGVHAYWLFKEAIYLNNGDHRRCKQLSEGWQKYIGRCQKERGWASWDNTSDLNRVLRAPGTFNRKGDPVAVDVIHQTGFPI